MRYVRCLPWTITIALVASGCALCPPGDDDAYSYQGGMAQRMHPSMGRAGSRFDEGGETFVEDGTFEGDPIDGPVDMDAVEHDAAANDVDMTFDGADDADAGDDR